MARTGDCIDIDDIGNLKDLFRLLFIGVDCGNIIVVDDVRELTRSINQKKVKRFTVAYKSLLSDKFCRQEYLSSKNVEYLL